MSCVPLGNCNQGYELDTVAQGNFSPLHMAAVCWAQPQRGADLGRLGGQYREQGLGKGPEQPSQPNVLPISSY